PSSSITTPAGPPSTFVRRKVQKQTPKDICVDHWQNIPCTRNNCKFSHDIVSPLASGQAPAKTPPPIPPPQPPATPAQQAPTQVQQLPAHQHQQSAPAPAPVVRYSHSYGGRGGGRGGSAAGRRGNGSG
ncbi:unnamed protein product, partial [Sphacelaria rigidula]